MSGTGLDKFKTLVISDDKVPVAAYQAIYHKLTQSTERLENIKRDKYRITIADLQNLHRIIEQSIQQYKVEAKNCSVNLSFNNGETEKYSSFERFNVVNFDLRNSYTSGISIVF